jgi:hypothetical protein
VVDEVRDESSGEIVVVPRIGSREDGDLQGLGILRRDLDALATRVAAEMAAIVSRERRPAALRGLGLVRCSRQELDLLDAEDAAPSRFVEEHPGEHPLRLQARREELDHLIDLIAHNCPENHTARVGHRHPAVSEPPIRVA